jgi:hypothetical protein
MLSGLSLVPHLVLLEIHQARLDVLSLPTNLPFQSLRSFSLLLCICDFEGIVRASDIDHTSEVRNVGTAPNSGRQLNR